jgi:hypothetical protein
MRFLACLTVLLLSIFPSWGQSDSVHLQNSIVGKSHFVYRLIRQEYITNENDFFLDAKIDTVYLHFHKLYANDTQVVYRLQYAQNDNPSALKIVDSWIPGDTAELILAFSLDGSVKALVNWKRFRDALASSFSRQVQAGLMTGEEFEDKRLTLNQEPIVRRLVAEDIQYAFHLSGDTLLLGAEYLRVKPVRSPFTGEDYYLRGNLMGEAIVGTRSVLIKASNRAESEEKQWLMQECREYLASQGGQDGAPLTELKGVGLNSEQEFYYAPSDSLFYRIQLSDVLVINNQSRGNIRQWDLWDVYE